MIHGYETNVPNAPTAIILQVALKMEKKEV